MTTVQLTAEEIGAKAPAVLNQAHAPKLSQKYVHVPTVQLIEDMEKLGWKVSDVKQARNRKSDPQYSKHMVVFRNDNITVSSEDGEVVYPQILLTNSHDGLSSFQFRTGIFRVVCTNGLVIATKEFGAVRIRHKGYTFEELRTTVMFLVEQLPITVDTLNKFREVILTEEQKIEFALSAIGIRFGENSAEVQPLAILQPSREEDRSNDLWTVLNTVQEKIIRGGFTYTTATNKTRKARSINDFNRDIELNEKLYQLAASYAENTIPA